MKDGNNASNSCGVIFDVGHNRALVKSLDERTADPNFWSNQEQAQLVLRDRKRAEANLAADEKLAALTSDLETYIELAKSETNAEQKEELLKDLNRELTAADSYLGELETQTLLSGENDHLNAIMTIKPGAGGTESQDWRRFCCACICDGRSARALALTFWTKPPAKKRASRTPPFSSAEKMRTDC
jgi:peptide chain release factor 2